ncbi:MerR family transcriptional regulator [Lactiplantibacillus daowaiensis]|uniref:MerR family transcriptional regulator n=1 Tax=Lactiplantibacillus daowaiensis TaxID=2559918 RepID=A0ABW1S3U0_9LACO|nr:MerR family transcriptional regulator [Lactiplantibacillus daowaiensis]
MTYAIGDVAAQCGVSVPTLRFYEKEGLLPPIHRDAAGRRQFSDQDVALVRQIVNLKRADASLDDIAAFLRLYQAGDQTMADRADFFADQADKLADRMAQLQVTQVYVQYKQWYYDQAMAAGGLADLKTPQAELNQQFATYLTTTGQTTALATYNRLLAKYPAGLCAVDLSHILVPAN